MNREKFEKLKKKVQNPRFIPGIYNYCDRWCARCPFTDRCMNYEPGEENIDSPESGDMEDAGFLDELTDTFEETMALIQEMADEEGIDLESMEMEEDPYEKAVEDKSLVHILAYMSKDYTKLVDDWFDTMRSEVDMGSNPTWDTVNGIEDSARVIRWFQFQIHIKLSRALSSRHHEKKYGLYDDIQRDSDGSAKVALIGLDRSIDAWKKLNNNLYDPGRSILKIVKHLDELRTRVELEFPEARNFIRPGFDEI